MLFYNNTGKLGKVKHKMSDQSKILIISPTHTMSTIHLAGSCDCPISACSFITVLPFISAVCCYSLMHFIDLFSVLWCLQQPIFFIIVVVFRIMLCLPCLLIVIPLEHPYAAYCCCYLLVHACAFTTNVAATPEPWCAHALLLLPQNIVLHTCCCCRLRILGTHAAAAATSEPCCAHTLPLLPRNVVVYSFATKTAATSEPCSHIQH